MNFAEQKLLDSYFSRLLSPRTDWNYDYAEDTGPSMQCPFCGESENVHYSREMKYGGGYYECCACGAFQEEE